MNRKVSKTLVIIGGGFLLALIFLRHPKPNLDLDATVVAEPTKVEVQEAQRSPSDDLSKVEAQAKSPHISIEISQAEAAKPIPSPSGTPGEPKKMSAKEFKELATKALKVLPKQEPKKGLTEEEAHHMTPEALSQFDSLADIAQAVADNPALKKQAFQFYYACASDDQNNLAWTARSRCLSKMRVLAPELGPKEQEETDAVMKSVPPSVREWSNFIVY